LTIKYIDFKVILPTMSICWNEGWQFCLLSICFIHDAHTNL
jgi:hypothetical protein